MVAAVGDAGSSPPPCRLCGAPTDFRFRHVLLRRHGVGFHRCTACGSLQTDPPHWLAEAYADPRPITDVGMVARTLELSLRMDVFLRILGVPQDAPCVDWAGGNGLFTRMMRDRGWNFFRQEIYTPNFYVPFHDADERAVRRAVAVTAFEALEHLPEPADDVEALFGYDADIVIATTEVHRDQPPDWHYIGTEHGQHVFFYSHAALEMIGRRFGMALVTDGTMHVFLRPQSRGARYGRPEIDRLVALMRDPVACHAAALDSFAAYARQPYRNIGPDHEEALRRVRGNHPIVAEG